MGLARMDQGEEATTLTQEGSVLGTIDYLAPEQALDAHKADIRSDLYSLGCTFYYILTGQPAFGGGTATEKLLKHRLEEPKPVEELRREVPAAVGGIVRKLMAKRPEDRYQTPADLVSDLTGKIGRLAKAAPPTNAPLLHGTAPAPDRKRRNWRWIAGGVAAGLLAILILGKLVSSGDGDGKPSGANPVASGSKPTGAKPVKPTQLEPRYVKMATREETILATLKSAGLPTLEGKWHVIGFFDMPGITGYEKTWPPEQEIDLNRSYTGKNNKAISWKDYPDFRPGKKVQLSSMMPGFLAHFWSTTYLYHEFDVSEAVDLPVAFGGNDVLILWLNGEKGFSRIGGGAYGPEQNTTTLRLKPGKNKLLIKLCIGLSDVTLYACPQWPAKLEATFGESLRRDFPR
jgi:hypothetical protein